jgi:hypothetical protein
MRSMYSCATYVAVQNTMHMFRARQFRPFLTKFQDSRHVYVKVSNIEFHEYLFSWKRADTCGQTTYGRTDELGEANKR